MPNDEPIGREVLLTLATAPFAVFLAQAGDARAQVGVSPVKVDTGGLVAKIKFEAPLEGFLKEINGKYKLRVTELTLAPGGHVGEHNHEGPGIRQVTSGYMTYVLPDKTVVYGPGDFFFESGDILRTKVDHVGVEEAAKRILRPRGGRWSVKNWTAVDDERLREMVVNGMDAQAIGIELNRTATAIRSRAFRLNLALPTGPRYRSPKAVIPPD